ncbi:MAG: hypothetical protein Ta2B_01960 [Termitinemataceae bacterium]|nr:MAG: hypothetical protein Ta2B_01960 [Termitinemataceae bacterium]
MIKSIAKLLLALNGNIKKSQIAAGVSWGLLLGLIPAGNAFWIILFVVSLFFKHNHAGKILFMALTKICIVPLYPAIDNVGWAILHIEKLQPLFTQMYNMPFVPFTKFNNTMVAGGIVTGIVLWLPVFFLAVLLIPLYRNTFLPKLVNNKIYIALQNFPLVQKIRGAMDTIDNIKNLGL